MVDKSASKVVALRTMKYLILLLLVTYCVQNGFAQNRQPRTSIGNDCPRRLGSKYKKPSKEEISNQVVKALESGDRKLLETYFPCDFMLVLPESDIGGFTKSKNILVELIKLSKTTKWSGKVEDFGSQFNVSALNSKIQQSLIFRKDDSTGWYWAGFSSSDERFLEKLLGSKLQHHGGEED